MDFPMPQKPPSTMKKRGEEDIDSKYIGTFATQGGGEGGRVYDLKPLPFPPSQCKQVNRLLLYYFIVVIR